MDTVLTYTDISGLKPGDNVIERLAAALPPYFREKTEEAKNERLKVQRLAGGLLLSEALGRYGYKSEEICVYEGPSGKPEIVYPAGFHFNLSHSGDLVLLALCDSVVGCDIQTVKSGGNIPARFFTADEDAALKAVDESERDELFTRLWARKESYIKATGEGMKRDLRSFSVLEDIMPDGSSLADTELDGYVAAICVYAGEGGSRVGTGMPDICFLPFQSLVNVLL